MGFRLRTIARHDTRPSMACRCPALRASALMGKLPTLVWLGTIATVPRSPICDVGRIISSRSLQELALPAALCEHGEAAASLSLDRAVKVAAHENMGEDMGLRCEYQIKQVKPST